jgi:transposase
MDVVHSRCAGLDVHKDEVVACVRTQTGARVERTVARFATTTSALMALASWLADQRCPIAVMEATGVYWKPVWHLLESSVALQLVHAAHVRAVPGRKSDLNDAAWLADLLAHGLLRASFVPPTPIQALRDLTRTRKQFVRQIAQHTLRLQKTLEDANVKITGVISDLLGASGRALLTGFIEGETDPDRLLARTTGRLQAPPDRLRAALAGRVTAHHRFLLQLHLDHIVALEQTVEKLDAELARALAPFQAAVTRLCTMPGVSTVIAQTVVAEIGVDMRRFPTPGHLVSWAGLCPRLDESAGKRRSTRVRPGTPWLKTALVQAAWAASHCRAGYLPAQFHRLRSRRGPKKALVAVAASMLTAVYFILRDAVEYRDLGGDYFHRRDRERIARHLTQRLEALGFKVALEAA